MINYTYNINTQFPNQKCNLSRLHYEIKNSVLQSKFRYVNSNIVDVFVRFSVALTSGEEIILNNIVSVHQGDGLKNDQTHRIGGKISPTGNGIIRMLGWYIQTDTAVSLDSTTPVTASDEGYYSHFVVNVSGATGLPFTIRVTGLSIDKSTGVQTPGDTEDINVTANGYYKTNKIWVDDPVFSIVEATKSCTIDIYKTSYFKREDRDFIVDGIFLEWRPDVVSWSIDVNIYKVNIDGSLNTICSFSSSNLDTPSRSASGEDGGHREAGCNVSFDGLEEEGLVAEINQTNIEDFYLAVKYYD